MSKRAGSGGKPGAGFTITRASRRSRRANCADFKSALHCSNASFETAASRPPQDEDHLFMASKKEPHPERERSEQSKDAAHPIRPLRNERRLGPLSVLREDVEAQIGADRERRGLVRRRVHRGFLS